MALMYRICLTIINIFFPPLTVLILTGAGTDTLLNCIFFLLAVIPSHIHGFYLSCTYFHRRKKVRQGRWPGGPKYLIASPIVLNGGATDAEAARLCRKEHGYSDDDEKEVVRRGKSGRRSKKVSRQGSRQGGSKRGSRPVSYQNPGYVGYAGGAGGSRPPSRTGSQRGGEGGGAGDRYSQRMSAVSGYGYPAPQRGGSQRLPHRAGSMNTHRAGYQSGYGSAPVSPVVGSTPGMARNPSYRSSAGGPGMASRPAPGAR
ncbi:MAG: hypothetical protein Q9165_003058 [Trypethelium subeluteriae]